MNSLPNKSLTISELLFSVAICNAVLKIIKKIKLHLKIWFLNHISKNYIVLNLINNKIILN